MKYIEQWTEQRRAAAKQYRERLAELVKVDLPVEVPAGRHVYHVFAVFVDRRDHILEGLHNAGVGAGLHYPIPVPYQKCFSELGHVRGEFPGAEAVGDRELSLPIFPELSNEQIMTVVQALTEVVYG